MNAMIDNPVREFANAAAEAGQDVRLSVLIPFFKDDPADLLRHLGEQVPAGGDIEILLHDDGEPDAELNARITRILAAMGQPARLLTSQRNRGRSAGRNLLAEQARGDWLIYLDADMAPVHGDFIAQYRKLMDQDGADAVFGGYETVWPEAAELQLHAALSRTSDQNDAATRNRIGATAFCASNILVRARVMKAVPYDTGYTGWGWEDVDWAVRAAEQFKLGHADNPARHAGLEPADRLLEKFRIGATNYARLLERNPQLAELPGTRAARFLSRIPGQSGLRGLWAALTRAERLPLRWRTLALKLWRASWTAEAIA
jgi:glycosyltransferase involved in cell wall biosynthesis